MSLLGSMLQPAGVASNDIISSFRNTGQSDTMTNDTSFTATSLSIPKGIWLVSGFAGFKPGTGTIMTSISGRISNSATVTESDNSLLYFLANITFPADLKQVVPFNSQIISVGSTTTYYVAIKATFSVSTLEGYGGIQAVKIGE